MKLHQSDRYTLLMTMFRAIASRAVESEETYYLSVAKAKELSVMVEDKLSVHICGQVEVTELRNSSTNTYPHSDEVDCPIQAKGLKKRQATSKARRRIKGRIEKSIAKKKMMQSKQGVAFCTPEGQSKPLVHMGNNSIQGGSFYASQGQSQPSSAMGNHSIQGVAIYISQGQSQPPFAMGSNYFQGHAHGVYISQSRPQSEPQPPFAMGRTNVHLVMYPTYDGNNMPQSMPLVYPT
ncbi:hypothetical protein ACSBR2_018683 [Camellia fascicularis]